VIGRTVAVFGLSCALLALIISPMNALVVGGFIAIAFNQAQINELLRQQRTNAPAPSAQPAQPAP